MNPAVYTRQPTLAQLRIGPMHDAQQLLRQEVALAKHEMRAELGNTLRAGMSLGLGIGIAAIGAGGGAIMDFYARPTLRTATSRAAGPRGRTPAAHRAVL